MCNYIDHLASEFVHWEAPNGENSEVAISGSKLERFGSVGKAFGVSCQNLIWKPTKSWFKITELLKPHGKYRLSSFE